MFDWNEDKVNQAKELVKKRISYTKIAKKLGTSKNSVMEKENAFSVDFVVTLL